MKITVTGYIHHKEAESYSDCYDRYGLNKNANKFAISDGVTSSFFPGIWADLLISEFTDKSDKVNVSDTNYLKSIQSIWFEKIKQIAENSLKWVQRKNFNDRRAALATFVGLHFFNENGNWNWEASAVGDSFLFFIPAQLNTFSFGENEDSVQYLSSKINFEFDNYPDYFSSYNTGKGEMQTKRGLLNSGIFLLMTDALSEWFINEKEVAFEIIKSWNSHSDFTNSLELLRFENRLHNDDSAILIINISNDGVQEINYQITQLDNISELTETENQEVETIREIETKNEVEAISPSETVPTPINNEAIKEVIQILPSPEITKPSPVKNEEKYVHRIIRLLREKRNKKNLFNETQKLNTKIKAEKIEEVLEKTNKENIVENTAAEIKVSTQNLELDKNKTEKEDDISKLIINKF